MSHYTEIDEEIEKIWDIKFPMKMNWLGLEQILVKILSSDQLYDNQKVLLSKYAIDAFTRRGHFREPSTIFTVAAVVESKNKE